MERETGFEPATPSLEGSCSSQLSYSRVPCPADVSAGATAGLSRARRALGGEGRIRTSEGMIQQIYSLPRLAASVPLLVCVFAERRRARPRSFPRAPKPGLGFESAHAPRPRLLPATRSDLTFVCVRVTLTNLPRAANPT